MIKEVVTIDIWLSSNRYYFYYDISLEVIME